MQYVASEELHLSNRWSLFSFESNILNIGGNSGYHTEKLIGTYLMEADMYASVRTCYPYFGRALFTLILPRKKDNEMALRDHPCTQCIYLRYI